MAETTDITIVVSVLLLSIGKEKNRMNHSNTGTDVKYFWMLEQVKAYVCAGYMKRSVGNKILVACAKEMGVFCPVLL